MVFVGIGEKKKVSVQESVCAAWLTWDGADVMVVIAAAVAGGAALVTPTAGDVAIVRLVASISAGSVWDNWKRQEAFQFSAVHFYMFYK